MDPTHSTVQLSPPQPVEVKPPVVPPAPPKRRRGWIWALVLVALAVVAYYQWGRIKSLIPAQPAPPSAGKGRGGGAATPVVATRATKGDIQIYYNSLGAVQPIFTVTVKSRVDGELMTVSFKEGQLVHKGDTLLVIDPRPYQVVLDQAEGNLIRDQALLKNAQVDLDRYSVLLKQEAIPEQTFATQEALVKQDQGIVKTDQAAIDSAKLNLVYCHITSPIDGVVGLRLVDPGNIVHSTDSNGLLVITQIDPISVIFTLPEDQLQPVLQKLHAGQKLPVQAWDRENRNKIADGTLETVDNQIDPTTGTLRLRANFANPGLRLFPSQFVNTRLLVDTHRSVTKLDNAAIQRSASTTTPSTYVWIVNPNSTVNIRNVTAGAVEGDQAEIVSGLNPGDEVVMVGVDKLQDGAKVNAQVPGETPQEPAAGGNGKTGKSGKKKS